MDKFWMVMNLEKTGESRMPTHEHTSFEDAADEAGRLCKKEGCAFAILECIGFVQQKESPVEFVKVHTRDEGLLATVL